MKNNTIPYDELPSYDQDLFKEIFNPPSFIGSAAGSGLNDNGYEGSYVNVRGIHTWDIDGKEIQNELNNKVKLFNEKSYDYNMEIVDYNDFDYDDDRTWDASYVFTFTPKPKNLMEYIINDEIKKIIGK